jgi:methylenetetrahydrofolate dehydrogenase (NADP+)/methenyltetrahydrofolate cyclohydrolase
MMTSSANGNFEMKNIKEFCKDWKASIKDRLSGQRATLYIIQVGDNEASTRYVRNKVKDALEVGIQAEVINLPEDISQMMTEQVIMDIVDANTLNPAGIIVQLPLPAHLDKDKLADLIPFRMDVDGFKTGTPYHACTPLGIITYLKACNFNFDGAHVVVIGRSDIVGKPVAQMLTDLNATVTLCHSHTKNLAAHIYHCDLIICAVGKAKFLNCYPIYVPVVDVGINFDENGKMCGDCFNVDNRMVTPVPGGVGLLTRCALMENMVQAATMFKNPQLDSAQIPVRLGE